jgi:hypothetical protein
MGSRKRPSQGWREFDHFYPNHVVFIRLARHLNTLSPVLLCLLTIIEQVFGIRCFQDICMLPFRYRPHKNSARLLIHVERNSCFRRWGNRRGRLCGRIDGLRGLASGR